MLGQFRNSNWKQISHTLSWKNDNALYFRRSARIKWVRSIFKSERSVRPYWNPASADIISLPLKQVSLRFIYKTALRHFVRLDVRSWVFEKKKLPREAIAHHLIPRQNIYD